MKNKNLLPSNRIDGTMYWDDKEKTIVMKIKNKPIVQLGWERLGEKK